jgi:hypothetical protein
MEPVAVAVTVKAAGVKGPVGAGCGFAAICGVATNGLLEEPHPDKTGEVARAIVPWITWRRVSIEERIHEDAGVCPYPN